MRGCKLSVVLVLTACLCPSLRGDEGVKIQPDIVYGRKDGMALTFDVLKPARPNGAGVLFIQSGGWYSIWNDPKVLQFVSQPLLAKGIDVAIIETDVEMIRAAGSFGFKVYYGDGTRLDNGANSHALHTKVAGLRDL